MERALGEQKYRFPDGFPEIVPPSSSEISLSVSACYEPESDTDPLLHRTAHSAAAAAAAAAAVTMEMTEILCSERPLTRFPYSLTKIPFVM